MHKLRNMIRSRIQNLCYSILNFLEINEDIKNIVLKEGDVAWCLMSLDKEKLLLVPPGHRIRPFVITKVFPTGYEGYACSSQPNEAYKHLFFYLNQNEYGITKSTYVDVSKSWKIPMDNVKSFYYRLKDNDFQELCIAKNKRNEENIINHIGVGTIVQVEQILYLIFRIDKVQFIGSPFHIKPLNKHERPFSIKGKLYYLCLSQAVTLENPNTFKIIQQLSKTQMNEIEKVRNEFLNNQVKNKKQKNLIEGVTLTYQIGTLFYNPIQDKEFVYLYNRNKKTYGVFLQERDSVNYILRRMDINNLKCQNRVLRNKDILNVLENIAVESYNKVIVRNLLKQLKSDKATSNQ